MRTRSLNNYSFLHQSGKDEGKQASEQDFYRYNFEKKIMKRVRQLHITSA